MLLGDLLLGDRVPVDVFEGAVLVDVDDESPLEDLCVTRTDWSATGGKTSGSILMVIICDAIMKKMSRRKTMSIIGDMSIFMASRDAGARSGELIRGHFGG